VQRTLGRTVLHRQRLARIIGLGDRASPLSRTPALVQLQGDPDSKTTTFPFTFTRDGSTSPALLSLETTDEYLAFPAAGGPLKISSSEGLHLPASLAEADSGTKPSGRDLLIISWQSLHHDDLLLEENLAPMIVILVDAQQLAGQPGRLIEALDAIRRRFPAALLWAPGIGGPDNCAVLAWFGVDLFDLGRVRRSAAMGVHLSLLGPRSIDTEGGESQDTNDLIDAGLTEWQAALRAVRTAIRDGRLRDLVEQQALSSASLVGHLRRHDAMQRHRLQDSASAGGTIGLARIVPEKQRIRFHSESSQGDPLVADWVARVVAAHKPPDHHRDTLLLLPCSMRKPYSLSGSHRTFARVIPADSVDEVSITSPLGIVPRSLEDIWPAAHYDIPVTGQWKVEELAVVKDLVGQLVTKFQYKRVVNHSGVDADFALEIPVIDTRQGDGATNHAALDRLSDVLGLRSDGTGNQPARHRNDILFERFQAASRFLHGSDAWMEGTKVAGKPPRWLLKKEGAQFAQWHPKSGRFAFSKSSLPILHATNMLPIVEIVSGVDWRGDIFSSNIAKWDSSIRVGDELLVVQDGQLIGSARANAAAWEWPTAPGRLARSQHRV
jgi:archaeosine synthase